MARFDTEGIAILATLFVLLSPGLLLTLPALSAADIKAKGLGYGGSTTTAATVCVASSTIASDATCTKATKLWMSGYMTVMAAVVHAVVYAFVVYMLPSFTKSKAYSMHDIVALAGLFLVLTPGVLLTLPALTKAQCGSEKKVTDTTTISAISSSAAQYYCNTTGFPGTGIATTNCAKCSSVTFSGFTGAVPAAVHGVVFAAAVYYLAPMMLGK